MTAFRPDETDRLDYTILSRGGVCLYFQHDVLAEDIAWLGVERYEIVQFDEDGMFAPQFFHEEARAKLRFPTDYEKSLPAFFEQLSKLEIPEAGGLAIILVGIEALVENDASFVHGVLDALSQASGRFILTGRRLVTLVQSEEANLELPPIGTRPIAWNPREAQPWARGL